MEFFQKKVEEGDTVILDNGAYEDVPVLFGELASIAKEMRPTVLILPDVPGKFYKTIQYSMNYLDTHGLPSKVEGMQVLHAEDGHLAAFTAMYVSCPVKWVGFSRLTKRFGHSYRRGDFARLLQLARIWRPELKHHALGMLDGDVEELKELASLGFESCDSSAPIWRGLHGYRMGESWPNYSFDPEGFEFAGNGLQIAEENLRLVMEACSGRSEKAAT